MPKRTTRPDPDAPVRPRLSVAHEDLEVARREALLQLRIGRSAHVAAIAVSAALALDAIIVWLLYPTLPTLAGATTGAAVLSPTFYLLLPLAGALLVTAVGVVSKWETFQVWPWERHFSLSVGALGLAVLTFVLYALRVAGAGPTGHLTPYPWLVLLSLAATSAGLVGIAATWEPWGGRQWTSALSAVAPVALGLLLFAPGNAAEHLALALLLSAILYQTSGSFLHLVSSGTGPHEDAVVQTGQNRIVRLAQEVEQREEAIRFRESALVKREAEAESNEAVLRRRSESHAERQATIEKVEAAQDAQADTLAAKERDLIGREAALEGSLRSLDERKQELELRAQELSREAPEVAAREERLAKAEGELTRRDVELQSRASDLDRREAAIAESEGRLAARRKDIEQKTTELLRREGDVTSRERSAPGLPTPGGGTRVTPPPADLADRESKLHQLKTVLDEQNAQLGRRSKDISEKAKTLEGTLRQIAERQAHLVSRETAISQREADLADRLKAADERRLQFESASRDYQRRLDEVGKQQVSTAQKGAGLDRSLQALADREKALADREAKLRSAFTELDRREGEVVHRERALEADAAEVSYRRQEIAREADLPFAGLLAAAAADRADAGVVDVAGRPGRGRRSRPAPVGSEMATDEPSMLAPASGRKYPDRLPTGTPRLDDLLLGGLPPKSHVALVGDAFVGKEVALYAFVAEGLKRSEPVLLVTASRSPAELAESLGVVLPQFRQYEQMGSVTWIDASGTGTTPGPRKLVAKSSDDRAGLLTALVQASKQAEETAKGGAFRVGFFGLSAVLAHADERASFSFLQNVVGILKPRNALAMYALEAGALSEAQVESLLGRMDGAILFKQDRDRTFLSVKGFGDVATHDWVEVRATGRSLVIGSFALERIR